MTPMLYSVYCNPLTLLLSINFLLLSKYRTCISIIASGLKLRLHQPVIQYGLVVIVFIQKFRSGPVEETQHSFVNHTYFASVHGTELYIWKINKKYSQIENGSTVLQPLFWLILFIFIVHEICIHLSNGINCSTTTSMHICDEMWKNVLFVQIFVIFWNACCWRLTWILESCLIVLNLRFRGNPCNTFFEEKKRNFYVLPKQSENKRLDLTIEPKFNHKS